MSVPWDAFFPEGLLPSASFSWNGGFSPLPASLNLWTDAYSSTITMPFFLLFLASPKKTYEGGPKKKKKIAGGGGQFYINIYFFFTKTK